MNFTASVLFGSAVGFAVYGWLGAMIPQPQLDAWMVAAGLGAFVLCFRSLGAAHRRQPEFTLSIFNVREIEALEADEELLLSDADRLDPLELLLTEADRVDSHSADMLVLTAADRLMPADDLANDEPLMLDDILTGIGPGARVVRLFDPKAMPTPGQLKSRIDSHLERGAPPSKPNDASQALSEALAELRRSLR